MTGDPTAAVAVLSGRTWETTVDRTDVGKVLEGHRVLSTRLFAGRTRVRVFADARPEGAFEPVPADLEDVYFAAIKGFTKVGQA